MFYQDKLDDVPHPTLSHFFCPFLA